MQDKNKQMKIEVSNQKEGNRTWS